MSYNGLIGGIVNIPDSGNPTVSKNGLTFYNGRDEEALVNGLKFISSFHGWLQESRLESGSIDFEWFKMDQILRNPIGEGYTEYINCNFTNRITGAKYSSGEKCGVTYEGDNTLNVNNYPTRNLFGSNNTIMGTNRYKGLITKPLNSFVENKRTNFTPSRRVVIVPSHRVDLLAININTDIAKFININGNDVNQETVDITDKVMFDILPRKMLQFDGNQWLNEDNSKINVTLSEQENFKKPIPLVGGVINNNRLPVLRLLRTGENV